MANTPDDPTNKVLNFLKGNQTCMLPRCWAKQNNTVTKTFQGAWGICQEPGWLMLALNLALKKVGSPPLDAMLVKRFAHDETDNASGHFVKQGSKDAMAELKKHVGGQAADLPGALGKARQALSDLGGSVKLSAETSAAMAVVAALESATGDAIAAADRATALALEANHWDGTTGKVNWTTWRTARNAQANKVRTFIHAADLATLISKLDPLYAQPPAGAKETKCPHGHFGPGIATPEPNDEWDAVSLSNPTAWRAYGTDDPPPATREGKILSNPGGQLIAGGSYTSPVGSYQWGYEFSSSTIGYPQAVVLTVTWTYSGKPPDTINVSSTIDVAH